MARSVLLVASGFALALVLVVAAALVALRALSGATDSPGEAQSARHADPDEARVPEPDEPPAGVDADASGDDVSGTNASRTNAASTNASGAARLTMNNVALVAAPGVTVDVVHMRGSLRSTPSAQGAGAGTGVDLEKPDSFDVVVDDAEVRVREAILQKLAWRVDRKVPGLAGARVALDRVLVRKGRVVQEGTLALGPLKMPFTITGTLAATPDGDVRVEVTQAHLGSLDTMRVVEALDIDLRKLMQGRAAEKGKAPPPGLKGGEGLSLFVSPSEMKTQPRMIAKVRSVRIEEDVVVVRLGSEAAEADANDTSKKSDPKKSDTNSLVIAGGHLVLGKMEMKGAIAELVDTDDDALMIDMKDFQRQLFASVCRATPQGVRIHMVDANDVQRSSSAPASKPTGR